MEIKTSFEKSDVDLLEFDLANYYNILASCILETVRKYGKSFVIKQGSAAEYGG